MSEPAANVRGSLAGTAARDFEAGAFLQGFLVAAIAAILLTRVFLELTGFPRLGGSGLHIAHMLWGGLLMLVALVLLLAVIGKRTKRLAALVGGAGFGLFIDETGKFITADNDYFFQPAIALIYTLLVVLFMAFRAIERRSLSPNEALANAADMLREVVMGGATETEISRALGLLEHSKTTGPLADGLREAIRGAQRAADSRPMPIAQAAARAWRAYDALIAWRWFQRAILVLFIGQAVFGVIIVAVVVIGAAAMHASGDLAGIELPDTRRMMLEAGVAPNGLGSGVASAATSLLSLVFVMLGVGRLRHSRLGAYRWFERSVLVSVFFGQVLLFWQDQLAAVVQLAWNLIVLAALRYAIRQEDARQLLVVANRS